MQDDHRLNDALNVIKMWKNPLFWIFNNSYYYFQFQFVINALQDSKKTNFLVPLEKCLGFLFFFFFSLMSVIPGKAIQREDAAIKLLVGMSGFVKTFV